MVDSVKNIKIGKVDENINHGKFSAPTIDIYDSKLNEIMAETFIQLSPKTKEIENDVKKDR